MDSLCPTLTVPSTNIANIIIQSIPRPKFRNSYCHLHFLNEKIHSSRNHISYQRTMRHLGYSRPTRYENVQSRYVSRISRPTKYENVQSRYVSRMWSLATLVDTSRNFYNDDDDTVFESVDEIPLKKPDNDVNDVLADDISSSSKPKISLALWFLGPFVMLTTSAIPTLWLPCLPLFDGSATAGLLSLAGLDGIFNLGAAIFLLITDACARNTQGSMHDIPSWYKIWTILASIIGLVVPSSALLAAQRGFIGTVPTILPISAMLGPYLALLVVHTLGEFLVWQWKSPVWNILPLVYNSYSILQLSRGLQLGKALGAPLWTTEAVKVLISWWVFVLAVHLMCITWFVGRTKG